MTGEVRFDNEGLRRQFTLDIVELTPSGLVTIGHYNASDGLHIARPADPPVGGDDGSIMRNKTYVVITALVSDDPTMQHAQLLIGMQPNEH